MKLFLTKFAIIVGAIIAVLIVTIGPNLVLIAGGLWLLKLFGVI